MRATYVTSHRQPRIAGLGRGRRGPQVDDQPVVDPDRAREDWPDGGGAQDGTAEWDGEQVWADQEQWQDAGEWQQAERVASDDGLAQPDAVLQPGGWAADDEPADDEDPVDLLHRAHDRLRGTLALRQIVEAVVDGLATGTASDVALLRGYDEGGWHVIAGSGLRTLEVRPLDAIPPLVGRLNPGSPVLTVAETDTVRGELAGLPLSRHRSLLVLRHPAELVTVLGRPDPFDQREVELATSLLTAALPHLERGWRTEALLLSLVDWFEAEAQGPWT